MAVLVKGGGGENVTPEVTAQTPLVTQILEGLVGKVQGANATADKILEGYSAYVGQELVEGTATKSGLYVWKKYQVTNATINITQITDSTANPIILQFSSNEIDFTTFDFSRLIGLSTTYSNETYSYTIKFISTTSVLLNGNSYSMSWNAETAQMTISASFGASFEFAPIVKDFYDFIDFVVSDSETEYPDGGEQGGYWYEKVKGFEVLLDISEYTKISIDKFTLSTSSYNTDISHSLGEIPKLAMIFTDSRNNVTENGSILSAMVIYPIDESGQISGSYNGIFSDINSNAPNYHYSSSFSVSGSSKYPSDTIIKWYTGSSSTLLQSGVEYTLITMA